MSLKPFQQLETNRAPVRLNCAPAGILLGDLRKAVRHRLNPLVVHVSSQNPLLHYAFQFTDRQFIDATPSMALHNAALLDRRRLVKRDSGEIPIVKGDAGAEHTLRW